MTHSIGRLFIAGAIVAAASVGGQAARAADPFMLTSSAYKDNAPLKTKNAGDNKANPNCVGQNVSPPVAWANPPDGTVSYALVLYDPEGRGGLGVVHMVTYGIPRSVSGFAEGELGQPSAKAGLFGLSGDAWHIENKCKRHGVILGKRSGACNIR